jgi:predicted ATP-dependent protease
LEQQKIEVCGTIDIEKALTEGIKAFEPGLSKANRGLLYVDEVNLLDDHLVDILLDSAASGWNTVEREESLSSGTFRISWIRKRKKRITSTAIR